MVKREKITVVNWYNIYPFNHGGSLAIRGLYKSLSAWFDITVVTFDNRDVYRDEVLLSPHLRVVTLHKPPAVVEKERAFYRSFDEQYRKEGPFEFNVLDNCIPASTSYAEEPTLVEAVRRLTEGSSIVITEHPYSYRLLKKACGDKILWYRAQNVEYDYKDATYKDCTRRGELVEEVYKIERECCEGVSTILTITQSDADRFHTLFGVPREKLVNISAGFDMEMAELVLPSARPAPPEPYRLSAFFISSRAPMAVAAAERVVELAPSLPEVRFDIAGNVGNCLSGAIPPNVQVLGVIDDEQKLDYLKTAGVALNLIEGGSGLNMKMLEYFAFGLPVITTRFGARGIDARDGEEMIVTAGESYRQDILRFSEMDMTARDALARNAFAYLDKNFSWRNAAEKVIGHIRAQGLFPLQDDVVAPPDENRYFRYDAVAMPPVSDDWQLYIWGSGNYGRQCLMQLKKLGYRVAGFIDNNKEKWGGEVSGLPLLPSAVLAENKNSAVVVLAALVFPDMIRQLVEMGFDMDSVCVCLNGDFEPYYLDFGKIKALMRTGSQS